MQRQIVHLGLLIAFICGLIDALSTPAMATPRLIQIETRDCIRNRLLVVRPPPGRPAGRPASGCG